MLAVAERGYPLSTPRPGWSEQDPEDWWRGAAEVLEELDAASAAGIGLSGQMHGLVALDAADRPLRPAILWNDGRTQAQCDEIEERIGFERLVELTGNRALAGFTAPKLLWLAEHEPEVYGRIAHILLPKDYVRLKLTDEHAIDVADASGTLLFDVAARGWSDEVVTALDVDPAWLPQVYESPAVDRRRPTAACRSPPARATRPPARSASAWWPRAARPRSCSARRGVVFAALDRYAHDPEARVHAFCHAVPAGVAHHGRDAQRGRLAAVAARDGGGHLRRAARRRGASGSRASRACSSRPTWPASARRTPTPPRAAPSPGSACATTAAPWRARCSRAWPSACATRSTSSRSSAGARASGASRAAARARSCGWRSSPRCSRCRSRRRVVDEGAAYGAALLGGVAAGVWGDAREAVSACVKVTRTIEPRPEWIEPYAEARERFRGLYPALRPLQA